MHRRLNWTKPCLIVWHDKHGNHYYHAASESEMYVVCLDILKKWLDYGYLLDTIPNDGQADLFSRNKNVSDAEKAEIILAEEDIDKKRSWAYKFLEYRCDWEYMRVRFEEYTNPA